MSSESKAKKFENLTNFANYSLKRPEEKTEENEVSTFFFEFFKKIERI